MNTELISTWSNMSRRDHVVLRNNNAEYYPHKKNL